MPTDLFLPEPEPREVPATIISVDHHPVEPADMSFRHPRPERVLPEGPST